MTMITLPMMTPSRVSRKSGEMDDFQGVMHLVLKFSERTEDASEEFNIRPTSPLLRGRTCPAFSLLALLDDGKTIRLFSRESFVADYVLLVFLPEPCEARLDAKELSMLRKQVEYRRNRGGSSWSCRPRTWRTCSASW